MPDLCSSCGERRALPGHDLCAGCDDDALDPEEAYDLDDPKHPTWFDRMADAADYSRKRERGE